MDDKLIFRLDMTAPASWLATFRIKTDPGSFDVTSAEDIVDTRDLNTSAVTADGATSPSQDEVTDVTDPSLSSTEIVPKD